MLQNNILTDPSFTRRFSTFRQCLGVTAHQEHLYVVETRVISVYEHHGNLMSTPQLIEQRHLLTPISHFASDQGHFSIVSNGLLEVRDRKLWERVITTRKLPNFPADPCLFAMQFFRGSLFIYTKDNFLSRLIWEEINFAEEQSRAVITLKSLGPLNFLPLCIGNLGSIEKLYVWGSSERVVELGLLFEETDETKISFEIERIEIKSGVIRALRYLCFGSPALLLVSQEEGPTGGRISLKIIPLSSPVEGIEDPYEELLEHIKQLQDPRRTLQIPLECSGYECIHFDEPSHFLWVVTTHQICKIHFTQSQGETIADTILYEAKCPDEKGLLVYQGCLVTSQPCSSLRICCKGQPVEEIQEEIEEDKSEVNICPPLEFSLDCAGMTPNMLYQQFIPAIQQDILTKPRKQSWNSEKDDICEHVYAKIMDDPTEILQMNIQFERVEIDVQTDCVEMDEKAVQFLGLQIFESYTQTKRMPLSFDSETQTEDILQHVQSKDLQELEKVVMKYSSLMTQALTKNFSRIKEANCLAQTELLRQVQIAISETFLPYVADWVKESVSVQVATMKDAIAHLLRDQINSFNTLLHQNQTKESMLSAKKTAELDTQIKTFKETCLGALKICQVRDVQTLAFQDIVRNEAGGIAERVAQMEKVIRERMLRVDQIEKELRSEIEQIKQIAQNIVLSESSKEEEDSEESESESSDQSLPSAPVVMSHVNSSQIHSLSPSIMQAYPYMMDRMGKGAEMIYPMLGQPQFAGERGYPYSGYYGEPPRFPPQIAPPGAMYTQYYPSTVQMDRMEPRRRRKEKKHRKTSD